MTFSYFICSLVCLMFKIALNIILGPNNGIKWKDDEGSDKKILIDKYRNKVICRQSYASIFYCK